MEGAEVERELWRIAKLREQTATLANQIHFLEYLIRNYMDLGQDPCLIRQILAETRDRLRNLIQQGEAAEQRLSAFLRFSRERPKQNEP